MLISVTIPVYKPRSEYLTAALRSALDSVPRDAEVILVLDAAGGDVPEIEVPEGVRVDGGADESGLAATWNRCLQTAAGELVHILHQDDLVTRDFYTAILEARLNRPDASLFASGFRSISPESGVDSVRDTPLASAEKRTTHLTGADAARFLLGSNRHCCGSVVLHRERALSLGGFSDAYPHSPDEEAYLRIAAHGGLVFSPEALYLARQHDDQARLRSWSRPDFVATYRRSRLDGARGYGSETQSFARRVTADRICSSMVTLAAARQRRRAIRGVLQLLDLDRSLVLHWRVWATLCVLLVPGGTRLALRRRARLKD
ncbi:MAG: glycosyltransferase family 2 protein [Gaiellaceae bacterium]